MRNIKNSYYKLNTYCKNFTILDIKDKNVYLKISLDKHDFLEINRESEKTKVDERFYSSIWNDYKFIIRKKG